MKRILLEQAKPNVDCQKRERMKETVVERPCSICYLDMQGPTSILYQVLKQINNR